MGVAATPEASTGRRVASIWSNVSPNAAPPVAKFLVRRKYKYEVQKKGQPRPQVEKTQEIKEDQDVRTSTTMIMIEDEKFPPSSRGRQGEEHTRFRGREPPMASSEMLLLQRVQEDVNRDRQRSSSIRAWKVGRCSLSSPK